MRFYFVILLYRDGEWCECQPANQGCAMKQFLQYSCRGNQDNLCI